MKTVRIVGVPEHFNMPWHLAMEEGAFAERGIDLQWTDVPEGSGKMSQMLSGSKTDMAIILTEGFIKGNARERHSAILQQYIASPLLWGIHVAYSSPFLDLNDLKQGKVAISRPGSGSHLMAFVFAESMGWDPYDLDFCTVHTIEGAVEALTSGKADFFMWERFTTKPLVDRKVFRRLGDCPTPWPCFVIAARRSFVSNEAGLAKHILEIINNYTREFRDIPSIDRTLANRYDQNLEDVREWLGLTFWSQSQIDVQVLESAIDRLENLNLIDKKLDPLDLLTNL